MLGSTRCQNVVAAKATDLDGRHFREGSILRTPLNYKVKHLDFSNGTYAG